MLDLRVNEASPTKDPPVPVVIHPTPPDEGTIMEELGSAYYCVY